MHSHSHGHGHPHAHFEPGKMQGVLKWAMAITVALVVVELVGGIVGRSIALISDAIHNLVDIPTMLISWVALRWAARPPTPQKTYGYHRAGILAAFTNAIVLVGVALYILYESYERLLAPLEVRDDIMLWVAVAALAVNGGITLALVRGRGDLNLRSVLIHNFGDALSNVAIIAGALAIRWTGAGWVDPVLGLGIGAMVLWSSVDILKEAGHILLEGSPREVDHEAIVRAILGVEGPVEVHDLHVWTLGTGMHVLTCHVLIPDMHMEQSEKILARIRETLQRDFHIGHATIQFERAGLPRNGLYMPAGAHPPEQ